MKISNTELAELILTRLYELAESSGYGTYWNIISIANEFYEKDFQKIFNIVKYLENYGFISPIYALGGFVHALITGQGAIFVENGGKTGIIRKYKSNPSVYIFSDISNSNIMINSVDASQEFTIEKKIQLIETIKNSINNEKDLSIEEKEDYLKDVESLKYQINKATPNKKIINVILESLSNVNILDDTIEFLRKRFE